MTACDLLSKVRVGFLVDLVYLITLSYYPYIKDTSMNTSIISEHKAKSEISTGAESVAI
jgi:hypothetical protein